MDRHAFAQRGREVGREWAWREWSCGCRTIWSRDGRRFMECYAFSFFHGREERRKGWTRGSWGWAIRARPARGSYHIVRGEILTYLLPVPSALLLHLLALRRVLDRLVWPRWGFPNAGISHRWRWSGTTIPLWLRNWATIGTLTGVRRGRIVLNIRITTPTRTC